MPQRHTPATGWTVGPPHRSLAARKHSPNTKTREVREPPLEDEPRLAILYGSNVEDTTSLMEKKSSKGPYLLRKRSLSSTRKGHDVSRSGQRPPSSHVPRGDHSWQASKDEPCLGQAINCSLIGQAYP